jgi:hypothetical protein
MANIEKLQQAIAAHASWKARLRNAISTGKLEVAIGTVKADDQCEFGKWLYGRELSAAEKQSEHYITVKQLHAQFHREAATVAELATTGKKDAAEKALGTGSSYQTASSALTEAMTKWRMSLL